MSGLICFIILFAGSLLLQRDRALIKDLLQEVDRYSSRNQKEREERAELERRRQHEAQHAQLVASQKSQDEIPPQFTAGGSLEQVCGRVHVYHIVGKFGEMSFYIGDF